jgi:hypothetical protein
MPGAAIIILNVLQRDHALGNGSAALAFGAPEEIVQSDRYFHPDLGYFCPAPRLRRELRVACYAGLFGVAVGATSIVIALSPIDRAVESASPVISPPTQPPGGAVDRKLASTERNDVRKPAAEAQAPGGGTMQGTSTRSQELSLQLNKERSLQNRHGAEAVLRPYEFGSPAATKARPHANQIDNGPDIARIPLGRPAALENATPPNPQADSAATSSSQTPAAVTAPAVAASATPSAAKAAPPDRPRAASVLNSKSDRMVRTESRSQKQHSDRGTGLGNVTRYARETALPRTVFWDWSR